MAIVLIAIGLLFTGVDFMVGSGISYPDFIQPTGLYHGIDIHPRIQQQVCRKIWKMGGYFILVCIKSIKNRLKSYPEA